MKMKQNRFIAILIILAVCAFITRGSKNQKHYQQTETGIEDDLHNEYPRELFIQLNQKLPKMTNVIRLILRYLDCSLDIEPQYSTLVSPLMDLHVNLLAISNDGTRAVLDSSAVFDDHEERFVALIDCKNGSCYKSIRSPPGYKLKYLIMASIGPMISYSNHEKLLLYNTDRNQAYYFESDELEFEDVVFSRSGTRLMLAAEGVELMFWEWNPEVEEGSDTAMVKHDGIWHWSTEKSYWHELSRVILNERNVDGFLPPNAVPESGKFSSSTLLAGDFSADEKLFVANERIIASYNILSEGEQVFVPRAHCCALSFWHVESGKNARTIVYEADEGISGTVACFFQHHDTQVVTVSVSYIRIFDRLTCTFLRTVPCYVAQDLFDNGRRTNRLDAFGGRYVAVVRGGGEEKYQVHRYDLIEQRFLPSIDITGKKIHACALSPDGQTVVVATSENILEVYHYDEQEQVKVSTIMLLQIQKFVFGDIWFAKKYTNFFKK